MNRHHYLAEGYRQLNNPQYYKRLPQPVHATIKPILIEKLRKMKHEFIITDTELNFLLPPTKPRERRSTRYQKLTNHLNPGPFLTKCRQGDLLFRTVIGYLRHCWIYILLLPRPRRGLRGIVFTRSICVSVCLSVCVCICVSGQYFGILFLGY